MVDVALVLSVAISGQHPLWGPFSEAVVLVLPGPYHPPGPLATATTCPVGAFVVLSKAVAGPETLRVGHPDCLCASVLGPLSRSPSGPVWQVVE
jgi:hypothetical protein